MIKVDQFNFREEDQEFITMKVIEISSTLTDIQGLLSESQDKILELQNLRKSYESRIAAMGETVDELKKETAQGKGLNRWMVGASLVLLLI